MKQISIVALASVLLLSGVVTGISVVNANGNGYTNPGTGTPGYWKNHPEAWPVNEIMIGGVLYTKAEAITYMKQPVKGDKTITMFRALVAAQLNIEIDNDPTCIRDAVDDADWWMYDHPVGSGVAANSDAWQTGEPLYELLDDYNNGLLCAPPRE